jgi:pimeloyl-ACP methyl ester carboxylesterase
MADILGKNKNIVTKHMGETSNHEAGCVQTTYGNLFYSRVHGSGARLVLVHGLSSSSDTWEPLVKTMPETFDLWAIDLLGHGRSDAPNIKYTVQMQANALFEFVRAKRIAGSYMLGHSYGGWIVARYAMSQYATKGILLENPIGLTDFFDHLKDSGVLEDKRKELMVQASVNNEKREHVMQSIAGCDYTEHAITKDSLSAIMVPTLVIAGQNDPSVDPKFSEIFSRSIPGAIFEAVRDADHSVHASASVAMASMISKFVEAAESRPTAKGNTCSAERITV